MWHLLEFLWFIFKDISKFVQSHSDDRNILFYSEKNLNAYMTFPPFLSCTKLCRDLNYLHIALLSTSFYHMSRITQKHVFEDFRPGKIQTSLLSYRS